MSKTCMWCGKANKHVYSTLIWKWRFAKYVQCNIPLEFSFMFKLM